MRVVIVGGGASGTITAIALLHLLGKEDSVLIAEPRAALGEGVAYSTRNRAHHLNVPALLMSCLPDDQTHFLRYLANAGSESQPGTFAPRTDYGTYLRHTLENEATASTASLRHARAEVVAIRHGVSAPLVVNLATGEEVEADHVVLCTGHGAPHHVPHTYKTLTPWTAEIEATFTALKIAQNTAVVIGTGLTAVDTILELADKGFDQIVAISRHGRYPTIHLDPPEWPTTGAPIEAIMYARTASQVIAAIRLATHNAGTSWRSIIDGLRPFLPTLWDKLDQSSQDQLVRHALPLWNTLRHRMTSTTAQQILALQQTGKLQTITGTITNQTATTITVRSGDEEHQIGSRFVIACTGYSRNPHANNLLDTLIASGLTVSGRSKTGLRTTPHGHIVGPASKNLHAVGIITTPDPWENYAIPSIRHQAHHLAYNLSLEMTP